MSDSTSRSIHEFSVETLEKRHLFAADFLTPTTSVLPATETYDDAQTLLNNLGAIEDIITAHDRYGLDGTGQTVAIIDSGVAYDHLALGGGIGSDYRVVGGYDFAELDNDPYDDTGFHGTHVAGIVGSSDETYTGLAPGVDFVALRVFDDAGFGSFSRIEHALRWVHEHQFDFENPITTVNISIGATWNASTTPTSATLENELAQLKADGIFTTAASGNLFQDYQVPGLNYPAASPHVVPVGSVNTSGDLSTFSQRHSRMLAAPGESIHSTVPDHLYSFDGVTDDFANSTGTSMAAPYVAGASVLLRQAMESAGTANITQDVLYDHFMETADRVFDGATNAYYSVINVGAALEAILGAPAVDGFGSTVADADAIEDLGIIDYIALAPSELPGSGDHETWYEMTAANDGWMSARAIFDNTAGNIDLEFHDAGGGFRKGVYGDRDSERLTISVNAGDKVRLRVVGENPNLELRLTNQVQVDGNTITVFGTDGDDTFAFRNGMDRDVIRVNGEYYRFSGEHLQYNVLAGAGYDKMYFFGDSTNETGQVGVEHSFLASADYFAMVSDAERVLLRGQGGTDTLAVAAPIGDGRAVERSDGASLMVGEFRGHARTFESVTVVVTSPQNATTAAVQSTVPTPGVWRAAPIHGRVFAEFGASVDGKNALIPVEESLASGVAGVGQEDSVFARESTLADFLHESTSFHDGEFLAASDLQNVEDYFDQLGSKLPR